MNKFVDSCRSGRYNINWYTILGHAGDLCNYHIYFVMQEYGMPHGGTLLMDLPENQPKTINMVNFSEKTNTTVTTGAIHWGYFCYSSILFLPLCGCNGKMGHALLIIWLWMECLQHGFWQPSEYAVIKTTSNHNNVSIPRTAVPRWLLQAISVKRTQVGP